MSFAIRAAVLLAALGLGYAAGHRAPTAASGPAEPSIAPAIRGSQPSASAPAPAAAPSRRASAPAPAAHGPQDWKSESLRLFQARNRGSAERIRSLMMIVGSPAVPIEERLKSLESLAVQVSALDRNLGLEILETLYGQLQEDRLKLAILGWMVPDGPHFDDVLARLPSASDEDWGVLLRIIKGHDARTGGNSFDEHARPALESLAAGNDPSRSLKAVARILDDTKGPVESLRPAMLQILAKGGPGHRSELALCMSDPRLVGHFAAELCDLVPRIEHFDEASGVVLRLAASLDGPQGTVARSVLQHLIDRAGPAVADYARAALKVRSE